MLGVVGWEKSNTRSVSPFWNLPNAMIQTHINIEKAILEYLSEARENVFNPTNIPASGQILARDLGIPAVQIRDVCERLANQGKLERFDAGEVYYRLPRDETATDASE